MKKVQQPPWPTWHTYGLGRLPLIFNTCKSMLCCWSWDCLSHAWPGYPTHPVARRSQCRGEGLFWLNSLSHFPQGPRTVPNTALPSSFPGFPSPLPHWWWATAQAWKAGTGLKFLSFWIFSLKVSYSRHGQVLSAAAVFVGWGQVSVHKHPLTNDGFTGSLLQEAAQARTPSWRPHLHYALSLLQKKEKMRKEEKETQLSAKFLA